MLKKAFNTRALFRKSRVLATLGRAGRRTLLVVVLGLALVGFLHLTRGTAVRHVRGVAADGAAISVSGPEFPLMAGQPVTTLLDADASKGVAVLGAIWINAPIRRYVGAVKNIETFESGGGFKGRNEQARRHDSTTSTPCDFPTKISTICENAALETARSNWGSRRSDDFGARSTGGHQLLVMLPMH